MLLHPNIDPVAVDLGFVQVHWYGIMYLIGFAAAYLLFRQRAKKAAAPFLVEQVDDVVFYAALGVIVGGRIGYILFYGSSLFDDPLAIFKVWQGGMSFHGGFIGVMISLGIYCKRQQVKVGSLLDLTCLVAPIGLGFGRLGNFIGQELWGRPTDMPWAMVFPADPEALARHPSQLYQAFFEGLILFSIMYWFNHKPRPRWSSAGLFVLLYGIFRFFVEFFREPDSHIGFDVAGMFSRGQLLSFPMIIVGFMVLLWAYKHNQYSDFVELQAQQQKQLKNNRKIND